MGAKSGCKWATRYLGRSSHCILLGDKDDEGKRIVLNECPFPQCIEDIKGLPAKNRYIQEFMAKNGNR